MFKLKRADRRLLAVGDRGAAYAEDTHGANALMWADFRSGRLRRVWSSRWEVEQVETDDAWLTWVEQERQQSEAVEPVSWRIMALHLGSAGGSEVRTVLSSRSKTPLAPGIALWHDTLFYSLYRGISEGTSDFHSRDLASGDDKVVGRDLPAGQMVYDGEDLIATLTVSRGAGPGQSRTDLFIINRQRPVRITNTGHSVDPQLYDGRLLWQSCRQASCSVMVQNWPHGPARQLLTTEDPLPQLGDGFLTILGQREGYPATLVAPLASPDRTLELTEPADRHLDGIPRVYGHKVAWLTYRGDDEANTDSLVVAAVSVK